MKNTLKYLVLLLLISCNENQKKEVATLSESTSNYAVELTMEGEVFRIKQENLEPIKKTVFKKDSILLLFWEDGNPIKLNFNLTHTNILETGVATYTIPEVNSPKIKVDLNFYNAARDVKTMNKRIIFRKGTIAIKKLTASELQMTFEGEGSGMMERGDSFPISGKVNVSY
ncbi:hypothetical protein [Aequorivita sp. Q41]|uniref:hypothetical protein n=1 Tax=Aequorivita sp. Q41 TaxID=3153300 RepID=UPI003241C77D